MKAHKNYLLAGSTVLLLVSSVFSVPRVTRVSDSKSMGQTQSISFPQESAIPLPASDRLAGRARLASSSISQATAPDNSDDLSIDASLGDENISLERKKRKTPRCCLVVISIIAVLVGRPSEAATPPMIDLRATVTGADAVRGSLPYALAWLAGDPDPLGSVRALGYDIDVSREHDRPCTDGPPSRECVERARRLATLLDATLGLGSPEERAQFRRDAAAIGIAPDCSPREP